MIDLFHLNSSCSTAVKAALTIADEPFSLQSVDLANKSDAFTRANPMGKVPAVVIDGQAITEGGAINLWISARNPQAKLMPSLDSLAGAEALKWQFFVYATLHPVWVRLFFPERFAAPASAESVRSLAIEELFKLYGQIDAKLATSNFIAGEALSLPDLYLAATIHWESALPEPITQRFPNIAAHKTRVLAIPGVEKAFAGEFGRDSIVE